MGGGRSAVVGVGGVWVAQNNPCELGHSVWQILRPFFVKVTRLGPAAGPQVDGWGRVGGLGGGWSMGRSGPQSEFSWDLGSSYTRPAIRPLPLGRDLFQGERSVPSSIPMLLPADPILVRNRDRLRPVVDPQLDQDLAHMVAGRVRRN